MVKLSAYLQLPTFAFTRLLNKTYENEVTLTGQNPPLECCEHIEILCTVRKKSRSLNAKNFGSVGKRAAKLLAVKFGVLKKKSAASAITANACAIAFGPGSNPGAVESFSKFDSWQF